MTEQDGDGYRDQERQRRQRRQPSDQRDRSTSGSRQGLLKCRRERFVDLPFLAEQLSDLVVFAGHR